MKGKIIKMVNKAQNLDITQTKEFEQANKKLMDLSYVEQELMKKAKGINCKSKMMSIILILTIMASAFTGYQFMQTQSITPVNSYE